jgi:hypothetical protein
VQRVEVPLSTPALAKGLITIVVLLVAEPQELLTVYVAIRVPAEVAVSTPADDTEPRLAEEIDHTPPASPDEVSVVVAPAHNEAGPETVPASPVCRIVTTLVALAVPQLFVNE